MHQKRLTLNRTNNRTCLAVAGVPRCPRLSSCTAKSVSFQEGERLCLRPVTGRGGTTQVNVAVVRRGLRQWKRILGTFLRRILCTEM